MVIIGDKEKENGQVTLRMRGNEKATMKLDEFVEKIRQEIIDKK